jgi:hypothetical protein
MTAKPLTSQKCTEARKQARQIERTINAAAGPRFARCTAPIRLRPSDLSSADQDPRYGLELRVEPLVTIADIRHEPAQKIAATLREWAAQLNQAADSLER